MASNPLEYFLHAAGPAARPTMRLGWGLAALSVGVCVIVAVLLVIAIVRRRQPVADPSALHGETGGMRWVAIGTVVSSVALLAALVCVMVTLERVAAPASHPRLTIDVTAYDWWWKANYTADADVAAFTTANEIHIPVGEPVRIALHSADVVHAFWVPQLAGKTQTIPGQTNEQWLQADRAGVYRGQCTQFCGAQHAHMAFEVIAEPRAAFDAWRRGQAAPASAPSAPLVLAGQHVFEDRCVGCHAVRGSEADGAQAPDLTHLASRRLIAAGTLTNTPAHLLDWIEHAQTIKPESLMPSIALDPADRATLAAYLATLR